MFLQWNKISRRFPALLLMCSGPIALAQFSGSVQGTVTDSTGAVVPGASLKLTAAEIGVSYSEQSDNSGTYHFSDLRPGEYVLHVERGGFTSADVHFAVATSDVNTENVVLRPGSANIEVTVNAKTEGVSPSETRVQTTLDSQEISRLPVLGRGIYNLVQVAPGVTGLQGDTTGVTPPDNFTIGTASVNASSSGRPTLSNNFLVDGISLLSSSSTGQFDLTPNPDSIQEVSFQTLTFNIDQGQTSALTANFTTKSGTNQFHGDVDWTYSSRAFRAHQYLEDLTNPLSFRRSYWGGSVGGPIIKDRTFFFGSAQIKRAIEGSTGNDSWVIPTELVSFMHQQFPNSNPAAILAQFPVDTSHITINPTSLQYAPPIDSKQAGSPCGSDPGNADNIIIPCDIPIVEGGNFKNTPIENGEQWNVRFDQYFRDGKDRFSAGLFRYNQYSQYITGDRPAFGNSATPTQSAFLTASYTHIFSPELLNDARFALLKTDNNSFAAGPYTTFPNLGLAFGPAFYCFFCAELGPYGPAINKEHHYNFRDVLTLSHGRHNLTFGLEALHQDYYTDNSGNYARPYNVFFNSIFDLLQDAPPSSAAYYTVGINSKYQPQIYGAQETAFAATFYDQWKVRSNLLLSFGGRFDIYGNPYDYGDKALPYAALFAKSASPADIANISSKIVTNAYGSRPYYFQPRVGFNWTPTRGDSKLSIRGGFGLYLDAVNLSYVTVNLPTNSPGRLTINYPAPAIGPAPSPFGQLSMDRTPPYGRTYPVVNVVGVDDRGGVLAVDSKGNQFVFPAGQNGFSRDLKPQKTALYSLGFEQEFPLKIIGGVTYSGSASWDQVLGGDYNALANGASVTPEFGQINYGVNAGEANYSGLIAVLRQQISTFQWQASYTWAHSLSDPLGIGALASGTYVNGPYDLKNQYSSSPYDVRNRLTFSGVYRVPDLYKNGWKNLAASGWELDAIVIAQGGNPYPVTTSGPTDGSSNADGRKGMPDLLNPAVAHHGFSRGQYRETVDGKGGIFANTGSGSPYFAQPASGALGNSPYDGFIGPGYQSFDLAAGKAITLPWLGGEKSTFLFRTEFINAFNRFNPGPVDSQLGDPFFGQSTSAYNPRILQFGARLQF